MEVFLGQITRHAMNYAIRSGIAITSSYAISQCTRLLKHVDDSSEHQDLQDLQERLSSKIRIISPAIDMIELISARGNTSLESAVTLTKALRWDIQSLGARLARAVSTEELSRSGSSEARSPAERLSELRLIIQDVRKLLLRIEDAVPLINLAITTSGASLSTTLPASVSPSRLLQASTFLTAGDAKFSMDPGSSVQIGPMFNLSVYMLFAGHTQKVGDDRKEVRHTKWKEAIHKARVKLMRVPLATIYDAPRNLATSFGSSLSSSRTPPSESPKAEDAREPFISSEGKANEFAYQLEIIEDLDDDRVHSFEDGEPQPGPYGGVQFAGIREIIPIHQISKIFYANTGKILNIGSDEGPNSPVVLLKRDMNAQFPRKMMERSEQEYDWYEEQEVVDETEIDPEDSQFDIDRQIRCENNIDESGLDQQGSWRFPPNLDPEWLAFEVYTETEDESSDDGQDTGNDSAFASGQASYSARKSSIDPDFANSLSNLHLESPIPKFPKSAHSQQMSHSTSTQILPVPNTSAFGPIRTSLSLLEVLIRLTSLQQFQQVSHLAISDELLTFFLEDSSTTGAGGDREERRRTRNEATQKVGFDPYTDSPIKKQDERRYQDQENETYGDKYEPTTPNYDYESANSFREMPRWSRERSSTPQNPPEWPLRGEHTSSSRRAMPDVRSSPQSPIPQNGTNQSLLRAQQSRAVPKVGSPLSRGVSVDTDSSLGTSPGSPSLGIKAKHGEGL